MSRNIIISSGNVEVEAELFDTLTADAIWESLPLTSEVNTWGDEIYFTVPVQAGLEADAKDIVEEGDLGYWPTGAAFCIFFGPTPVSRKGEIRPASAVNVFGKVNGSLSVLRSIDPGTEISVKRAG